MCTVASPKAGADRDQRCGRGRRGRRSSGRGLTAGTASSTPRVAIAHGLPKTSIHSERGSARRLTALHPGRDRGRRACATRASLEGPVLRRHRRRRPTSDDACARASSCGRSSCRSRLRQSRMHPDGWPGDRRPRPGGRPWRSSPAWPATRNTATASSTTAPMLDRRCAQGAAVVSKVNAVGCCSTSACSSDTRRSGSSAYGVSAATAAATSSASRNITSSGGVARSRHGKNLTDRSVRRVQERSRRSRDGLSAAPINRARRVYPARHRRRVDAAT